MVVPACARAVACLLQGGSVTADVEVAGGTADGFSTCRNQARGCVGLHACFGAVVLVPERLLCPPSQRAACDTSERVAVQVVAGFHGFDCSGGPDAGVVVPKPWGDVTTAKLAYLGVGQFQVCGGGGVSATLAPYGMLRISCP